MTIAGNEVAVANEQRRKEQQASSPISTAMETGVALASSVATLSRAITTQGSPALSLGISIVAGLGLVECFRKLGSAKVNENLEALGQATEDALNRVERVLLDQGESIEQIKHKLDSENLRQSFASASIQALRTTQSSRLKRLALVIANGVLVQNDSSGAVDDMMRAAVELSERDVQVLCRISEVQSKHGLHFSLNSTDGPINRPREVWRELEREGFISTSNHMSLRSSLARLQSLGFGAEIQTMESDWRPRFLVTPEGETFLRHLKDIDL